ncbi:MAG: CPBP family intramembrane glutamic endopeptidase [Chloroflexota bacterium]
MMIDDSGSNQGRFAIFGEYFKLPEGANFTPLFYLQLLIVAEVLTNLRAPSLGLILHSIVLVALMIHGALDNSIRFRRLYLTLSVAPLMRVISLSLPVALASLKLAQDKKPDPLLSYFWVGVLVYIGMFFANRFSRISAKRLGINLGKLPFQLLFGVVGVPLGLWEYYILKPAPVVPEFTIEAMLVPAFVLIIFTGVLEEVLFRGLIQQAAITVYGRYGITFSAILFAVLHVGYGSIADVLFVFGVAILFGLVTNSSGSLLGVSIAHGLTNIGLLLVFPHLIGDMSFNQLIDYILNWISPLI